jgi:hypothetical protein
MKSTCREVQEVWKSALLSVLTGQFYQVLSFIVHLTEAYHKGRRTAYQRYNTIQRKRGSTITPLMSVVCIFSVQEVFPV